MLARLRRESPLDGGRGAAHAARELARNGAPNGETTASGGGSAVSQETRWTLIRDAASGDVRAREEFARLYGGILRSFFQRRWRSGPCCDGIDDAAQEVFLRCFEQGGVLDRADDGRPGGFRAFLFGVARNVALEHEARVRRRSGEGSDSGLDDVTAEDESASRSFDRAWARGVMRQAREFMHSRALAAGERDRQRVEILRLRFEEGLPIRDVARLLGLEAAYAHHEYAIARKEFRAALAEAVALYLPGSRERIDHECELLLALLS
jgi:RNA polymerase sigma factor (sigma-70 family)